MVLNAWHAPAKLAFVAVLSSSYASLAFTKNRRAHIAPSSVSYCIKFLFGIRPSFFRFRYNYFLYLVKRNLFFTIPTLFFRIEILQRTFFSIEIRTVENFTS